MASTPAVSSSGNRARRSGSVRSVLGSMRRLGSRSDSRSSAANNGGSNRTRSSANRSNQRATAPAAPLPPPTSAAQAIVRPQESVEISTRPIESPELTHSLMLSRSTSSVDNAGAVIFNQQRRPEGAEVPGKVKLRLTIVAAYDLPKRGLFRKISPSPYVEVQVAGQPNQVFRTKVMQGTCTPKFDQTFNVEVPQGGALLVTVYHTRNHGANASSEQNRRSRTSAPETQQRAQQYPVDSEVIGRKRISLGHLPVPSNTTQRQIVVCPLNAPEEQTMSEAGPMDVVVPEPRITRSNSNSVNSVNSTSTSGTPGGTGQGSAEVSRSMPAEGAMHRARGTGGIRRGSSNLSNDGTPPLASQSPNMSNNAPRTSWSDGSSSASGPWRHVSGSHHNAAQSASSTSAAGTRQNGSSGGSRGTAGSLKIAVSYMPGSPLIVRESRGSRRRHSASASDTQISAQQRGSITGSNSAAERVVPMPDGQGAFFNPRAAAAQQRHSVEGSLPHSSSHSSSRRQSYRRSAENDELTAETTGERSGEVRYAHPTDGDSTRVDLRQLNIELPAGWEARVAANGRVYYCNHAARSTQWERPTQPAFHGGTGGAGGRSTTDRSQMAGTAARTTPVGNHTAAMNTISSATARVSLNRGSVGSGADFTDSTRNGRRRASTSSSNARRESIQSQRMNFRSRNMLVDGDLMPADDEPPSAAVSEERLARRETDSRVGIADRVGRSMTAVARAPAAGGTAPTTAHGGSGSGGTSGGSSGGQSSGTATNSGGLGPLPDDWELMLTPAGQIYFINHATRNSTWYDPRITLQRIDGTALSSTVGLPPGWEQRYTAKGRPYFVDHNTRTTQFEDPRVSLSQEDMSLPRYRRDLKRKLSYLRGLFRPLHGACEIIVTRDTIFEESYAQIMCMKPERAKAKLKISFTQEDALDYGGVAREWFFALSKEMFNPAYGLFIYAQEGDYLLQINPASDINPDHLSYFQFIGRVIGMAIYHGHYVDAGFIQPIYKKILGKPIVLEDLEAVDPDYYNNLLWILDNDVDEADLGLTFSVDYEVYGDQRHHELKENGTNVAVTNANKQEYVDKIVEWHFLRGIDHQLEAFLNGIYEMVPLQLLRLFDEQELELVICGLGDIDLDDLRKNTEYKNCSENDMVIKWFWKAVNTYDVERKVRFVQFVTGTSRIPVSGFRDLQGSNGPKKFMIEKVRTLSPQALPKSHTCFNRIDLPPYQNYQTLLEKVTTAVEETCGFGIE
eukprot:Clim_evm24s242 gene=Clim_evmTU24s242